MRQDSPGSIDARTERGQQTIIVESPLGKNGALILWASAVMGAISIVSIIATVLLFKWIMVVNYETQDLRSRIEASGVLRNHEELGHTE